MILDTLDLLNFWTGKPKKNQNPTLDYDFFKIKTNSEFFMGQKFDPFWPPFWMFFVQVNLFQKHIFLDQLTHNMTNECSLIYQFSIWKLQTQNMGRTYCVQKNFWMSKQKQICVHIMFSPCCHLWVSWCENKCFWQRFTCTEL